MTVLVNQSRHSGSPLLPLSPPPICGSLTMLRVHFHEVTPGYTDQDGVQWTTVMAGREAFKITPRIKAVHRPEW